MKKDIECIVNTLKSFAEDNRSEMSVNVHQGLWDMIQTIEYDCKLGQYAKKVKK